MDKRKCESKDSYRLLLIPEEIATNYSEITYIQAADGHIDIICSNCDNLIASCVEESTVSKLSGNVIKCDLCKKYLFINDIPTERVRQYHNYNNLNYQSRYNDSQYSLLITQLPQILCAYLSKLVYPDHRSGTFPINVVLHEIKQAHKEGLILERDTKLGKLTILKNKLILVSKRPDIHERFKNKFRKDDWLNNRINFNTNQFELYIAGTLIEKNIKFDMPDPPDFVIDGFEDPLNIECTSCRSEYTLAKSEDALMGNLKWKVEIAVKKKSKKGYCSKNTLLCIEITNILYTLMMRGFKANDLDFESLYQNDFYGYGGIVLYYGHYDVGRHTFRFKFAPLNPLENTPKHLLSLMKIMCTSSTNLGTSEDDQYVTPDSI